MRLAQRAGVRACMGEGADVVRPAREEMRMYRRYGDIPWDSADAPAAGASGAAGAAASTTTSTTSTTSEGGAAAGIAHRARGAGGGKREARARGEVLPSASLPTIRLHGVRLHAITEERTIDHILDELDAGRGGTVVTPNLDHIRRCTRDMLFGAIVAEADLVVADGMPLVWASKLQGTPLPQRVAGSDLISSLSREAAKRGRSIFLLGGAPGTAEAAAKVLQEANPTLKIAGVHCPPVGFENNRDAELEKITRALAQAKPHIVFVALGSPKQEYLIQSFRRLLPASWWLGVGISFSFLCGDVKRAPKWAQKIGLEWVHRLVQDPKRLFHRYIVSGLPFAAVMLSRACFRGISQRFGGKRPLPDTTVPFTVPMMGPMPLAASVAEVAALDSAKPQAAATTPGAEAQRPRRRNGAATEIDTTASGIRVGNLARLRAMVLLGGSVRSRPLVAACDRSVLDLPLDAEGSIFNHWLKHATELARYAGIESLPVRVMVNRNAPEPVSAAPAYYGKFRVERDLSEYRGTGGVLRDLAADYDDDDLVLVCNAAQILLDPLAAITTALDRKDGDVTLVSHNDGIPSGVQLIRCDTLRMIPDHGFVDMKEQALPLIASKYNVTVLHCRRPTGLPIRTLADYIGAMRHYHRRSQGKPALSDPLAEDWQPAFAIVEQGASLDPSAHVHDAVVLKGGVVEKGAVVVRSIVCPGGVVKKDRPAVDQLVCVDP
jgi:N-acetylglucosaminyldiphosphoundecaprenol N-acetyl-beta-D-mannosaminyltransferase